MKHHKTDKNRLLQIILLAITGFVLGFLILTQAKYFTNYVATIGRDSTENVFRKIQILKTSNDELKEEVATLEKQLDELSNQAMALDSIDKDIKKNQLIAGVVDIWGPGIELSIDSEISEIWFTDIINEFLSSGAETVSVNKIRLTDSTAGIDTLPNGQIMLNGVILKSPYTFSAIGDKVVLKQTFESPLGILERMKATFEKFEYTLDEKDRIEIKRV